MRVKSKRVSVVVTDGLTSDTEKGSEGLNAAVKS